jgi:hypothetical protein
MNLIQGNDIKEKTKKVIKLDLEFCVYTDNRPYLNYISGKAPKVHDCTSEKNVYYIINENSQRIFRENKQNEIKEEFNILFLARKSNKGYYELIWPIVKFDNLDLYNLKKLDNKMWLLIKTEEKKKNNNDNNNAINPLYENEEYYLSENDIIEFGERKYEVIKLNINSNKEKIDESKKLNLSEQISEDNKNFGSVFYLPEKSKKNGKTLSVCKCEDKINFNINDLKPEIKKNSEGTIISYEYENFNCEECHEPYSIKYNNITDNEIFSLFDGSDFPENTNYMILESLTLFPKDKNGNKKNNTKNIFVIKLTEKEIKIGRSDKNDIIDKNNSISGEQAVLKFDEKTGRVKIQNKSKFGTSVLIKNNVKLELGQKLNFKVGNTYIKAEIKEEEDSNKIEKNDKINSDYSKSSNIDLSEFYQ